MLKDKILKYIQTDNTKKIFLLFDENNELQPELETIDMESLVKIFYSNNPLKIKLEIDKIDANKYILIYIPLKEPESQNELREFPLLDLMVAGKVIRLDDVAGLMEDLVWRVENKNLVTKYKDELKYKYVSDLAAKLDKDRLNEDAIIRVMFSAWLGSSEIMNEEWIIGRFLIGAFGSPSEHKTFLNKLDKYQLNEKLKTIIRNYFSKEPQDFSNESIVSLLGVMKYNCITLYIPLTKESDPYSKLKISDFSKAEKLNNFREFLYFDPAFSTSFPEILLKNSKQILEDKIFRTYKLKEHYAFKTPELVWLILKEISLDWETKPERVINDLPEIRKEIKVASVQDYAAGFIYYSASVVYGIKKITNFLLNKPEDYINNYTEEWYKVDQDYRQAINVFKKLSLEDSEERIGIFDIHSKLNKIYNAYLANLNKEWLACWSSKSFELDKNIVPHQSDFYNREVMDRDVKLAVIISDGFRFEIAKELLSVLHQDSRNKAEIRSQFCSLPSITSVGMANLLPGKDRKMLKESVEIDGMSTISTKDREKILQIKQEEAEAHLFSKVANLSQDEGRKIFSSPLVYIYHDRIDNVGDKTKTEDNTFEAAEKTIQELASFIKKLHSSYYVSRVIITADHGFLYTNEPLDEKDLEKAEMDGLQQKHSRYLIVEPAESDVLGYKIPISKVSGFNDNLELIIPEGVNRYKVPGSGTRYVHGGASLQELVVPVIESIRKRKDVSGKVNIIITNKDLKVVSNVLRIKIFQQQQLSAREKELRINIGIYKNRELVSELKEMVFESVSENPSERMQEVILNLKPGLDASGILNLIIYDIEDTLNALYDIKVINSSAIDTDF